MQFEIGMSISRYLPASGTAGFERYFVSGYSRVPCPPPKTTATTFFIEECSDESESEGERGCMPLITKLTQPSPGTTIYHPSGTTIS